MKRLVIFLLGMFLVGYSASTHNYEPVLASEPLLPPEKD